MMVHIKKTSVVICANSSWYIYNFRRNTIKAFVKDGHQVFVIAPSDDSSKHFSELGARYCKFDLNPNGTNVIKEALVIFKLVLLYSKIRPNVVMNFTPKMNIYSTIAAVISRSKIVNNISGLGTAFSDVSIFSQFVVQLYRFTQIFADKVFFQNNDDMEMFISRNIVSKHKCEYIPGSGVDLERFEVTEAPDDGVVRFVIICRMLYEKGIERYAQAAEFLRG